MADRQEQTPVDESQDTTPVTQAVLTQQLTALTQSFARSLGAIEENFKLQQRVTESQNQALAEQQRSSLSLQRSLQEITLKAERGHRDVLESLTQLASRLFIGNITRTRFVLPEWSIRQHLGHDSSCRSATRFARNARR